MSSPIPTPSVPTLEVEQPRTYRIFRLLVDEILPPPPSQIGQFQGNIQTTRCDHKQVNATIADLIKFAELLSPTDKALLKAVL